MEAKCMNLESCSYLGEIKKEIDGYQKCVEKSLMDLNNLNIKYEKTVREMGSIFDLFQHINLITDYNNLFTIINDMLIGVMGVTGSTIFSQQDNQLVVEASSISRKELKNIEPVKQKLKTSGCLEGKLVIYSAEELNEEVCKLRNIRSAAAVPLMKHDECMGVIFLEHTVKDYFQENNEQFLSTLAVAVRLAIENARLYSSLESMTLKDEVAGLFNKKYFDKELQNCIHVYNRYGIQFIVAVTDIDHFMKINDVYGREAGDGVIKNIGKLLASEVRKGDIVCRVSGDQFGIIFRNTNDIAAIYDRVNNIRGKIASSPICPKDLKLSVSCSFGIASSELYEEDSACPKILALAEAALDKAKEQGRNRVILYEK